MDKPTDLDFLLEKLAAARFSGKLILVFNRGEIESADLTHFLQNSEFKRPIPVIEESEEFALKP
jgi:hypothetical protein